LGRTELMCYLKLHRLRRGMNQEDVAKKLYISRSMYSRYESCKNKLPDEMLHTLAELYGIDYERLRKYRDA